MDIVEAVEIELDQTYKIKFTHGVLFHAQREINKLRGVDPENHLSIHFLMKQGMGSYDEIAALPQDLLLVMLWAALREQIADLTVDAVAELCDRSPLSLAELNGKVISAFFRALAKNLVKAKAPADDDDKKKLTTGSPSGALAESSSD